MFCPNCGQQIPDNSTFCSSCGNAVAQAAGAVNPAQLQAQMQAQMQAQLQAQAQMQAQFQMQKNAVRQSEIQELDKALRYFSVKKEAFDNFQAANQAVAHYSRGAKAALIIWGAIIAGFGLIALIAAGSAAAAGALLSCIIPGAGMIAGGVLMKVKNKKNLEQAVQWQEALCDELAEYYVNYPGECPVGAEYCDPDILDLIMDTLQSGRADTIKEAINLLLQQIEQEEQMAYLAALNAQADALNAKANASLIIGAANLLK